MINDPELKAMSEVYNALHELDSNTQKRVVDWVLAKLESSPMKGLSLTEGKRGPKSDSKRKGKKRGPKPGFKRKGKRGRPPGTKNRGRIEGLNDLPRRRGRPRKTDIG